jgi:cell division protein FtsA
VLIDKVKSLIGSPDKPSGKTRYIVALDVGTVFVKALICRVKGTEAEVIGAAKVEQDLSAMQSGAVADISSVVETCDQALSEAEKIAGVDARDVVIGIAGELVKGTTTTVRYRRKNKDQEMTLDEIENIVSKAQAQAYERARRQLALESGNEHIDVRLVNSSLVNIEIDGYQVTNPVGFQGGNVAVQLYTAFAPMIHIGALERIATELDLNLIALAAEPFAVARSVVGNDMSANFSAILIDVGGGTTDIAVVRDGGVEGTQMFGIGGRAYTRIIANELDVDFTEAEKLKIKLGDAKLPTKQSKKVLDAVEKTLDVWVSGVQLALDEFKQLEHLPNRVLLCGGGASLSQIVSTLTERDWYKNLAFTKKPRVQYIAPSQVVGIVDKTSIISDHTYITAMGLVRVGIDSVVDVNEESSWRERIDRLLSI